jgi:bacterioferritin (cytochrome b1)
MQNILPVTDLLNQLLHMLCRGLPAYVVEIKLWMQPEHRELRKVLVNLANDRTLFANRTAQIILNRGGHPDPGSYPLEFTGLNDVSIDYLTQELIDSLQMDIEILEAFSTRFASIPDAHVLAEEIIGNTKGHVEILEKGREMRD